MVNSLGYQQRTIAVAQESEVMAEGIVVYLAPVAFDEGRHKQQQCALGLMEVGDDALHDMEGIAWSNHDLRIGVQGRQVVTVKILEYLLQGLQGGQRIVLGVVGHPLGDTQLLLGGIGITADEHTYIIEALEGAHRGGTHGNGFTLMGDELHDSATLYYDIL